MKSKPMSIKKGIYFALFAGILWGASLGAFSRCLSELGFLPMQITAVRVTLSAILFVISALVHNRQAFRIQIKDVWIFFCAGLVSITAFSWCYFTSTKYCSLAVAEILSFTSPIWVLLLSALLFHEHITKLKKISIFLVLFGCILVCGMLRGVENISVVGILTGLMSGIAFATYTIFTRFAVTKYTTLTINLYSFIIAALSAIIIGKPEKTLQMIVTPEAIQVIVFLGTLCGALPYYLYTKAMEVLDNSTACILTTIEPVVATVVSVYFYHEKLYLSTIIGIIIIITAVTVVSLKNNGTLPRIHSYIKPSG